MPKITKRFVDAAEPGRHYDGKLPGFGLYVGSSGVRSYFFEYRPGRGRGVAKRRISIGRHGAPWTPDQARDKAHDFLMMVKSGEDPLAVRASSRQVSDVVEEWLKRDQVGNRSRHEVERIMRREVLPLLGARLIEEIRKRDIIALVDGVIDRGTPIMANRTLAHMKRMFRWAAARDIIEFDPAAHVEKPAQEVRRDRVLTDYELAAVWAAAEEIGYPYGRAVQLLILTGARRQEILDLSWNEVEGGSIRLSSERTKNAEARAIPLSPRANVLLDDLPRVDDAEYVFSVSGNAPFKNLGHSKGRLDAAITQQRGEPLSLWRIHDIRRTVATGLQKLGARLEVIEAVLGHVGGSRAGIVGVYQRHRFDAEAREALVAWSARLQRLIDGRPTAVVTPLHKAT